MEVMLSKTYQRQSLTRKGRRLTNSNVLPRHGTVCWSALKERVEGAVKRLTQFTRNVRHDLCTSMTVMLSTSQLPLRRERSSHQYRIVPETIMSECQSTATMLDDLFSAARSDVARQKIE